MMSRKYGILVASLLTLTLASLCIYAFYPGWMSQDSLVQYQDALNGVYRDWMPILYSWIWNKFLFFAPGPISMLLLNIVFYWAAFFLISSGLATSGRTLAALFPLLGLFPGILYELGFIWKDILFGTSMLLAWGVLIHLDLRRKKPPLLVNILLALLCTIAYGVKTNGITAIPFLIYYWIYVSKIQPKKSGIKLSLAVVLSVVPVAVTAVIASTTTVIHKDRFLLQYTMVYDLLGISCRTHHILFPLYIKQRFGSNEADYCRLYYAGGNNHMFFGIGTHGKNARSANPNDFKELTSAWVNAVSNHPIAYAVHRWENISSMLRIGSFSRAWVGDPGILPNSFGLKAPGNTLAAILSSTREKCEICFLPWLYLILLVIVVSIPIMYDKKNNMMVRCITLSIIGFLVPHYFILPAVDFRYLYYVYIMVIVLCGLAIISLAESFRRLGRLYRCSRPVD